MRKAFFVLFLTLVLAILFVVKASANFKDFTKKFVPIPQSESVVEMYFQNPDSLAKTVKVGEKQTFTFTIHNLDNNQTNYLYQVILSDGRENRVIDTKKIIVLKNTYKSILESYIVDGPTNNAKILVTLPYENTYIDYKFSVN